MSGLGDLLGDDDDFVDYEDEDMVEDTAPTAESSPVKPRQSEKVDEPTVEKKRSRCQHAGPGPQTLICVLVVEGVPHGAVAQAG